MRTRTNRPLHQHHQHDPIHELTRAASRHRPHGAAEWIIAATIATVVTLAITGAARGAAPARGWPIVVPTAAR